MTRYNILFPTGVAGKPDDLIRRARSLYWVYDVAAATVDVPDGPSPPTAEYVNSLFAEYAGTATLADPQPAPSSDPSGTGDKE